MLGRAALKLGRIAPVGARCAGGGGGHSEVPSIPATSGEIALPRDKSIFIPTPTPENISQETKDKYYPTLGNRDIVGPSFASNHEYLDEPDQPMPGVRFAANTPEVLALREKELGDWTQLTLEDKKQLYRNSFRQTLAEVEAPTGDWKRHTSFTIYLFALALLYQIYMAKIFRPDPEPYQNAMNEDVVFQIVGGANPTTGDLKHYNYETNKWK